MKTTLSKKEIEEIRKNPDKQDWRYLSYHYKLTESFIREFQNKVQWYYISKHQKLSEPFIKEFKDKVDWWWISYAQILSEPFIKEFQNKVDWMYLNENERINKYTKLKIQPIIDRELLIYQLSKDE